MQLIRLADGVSNSPAESHVAHASYAHTPLFTPTNDNWIPLSASDFKAALEANALEGGYIVPADLGGNKKGNKATIVLVKQLTVSREDGDESARDAWREWLLQDVGVTFGDKTFTYSNLCYGANCASSAAPKLVAHALHPGQETITLILRAPSPDTPSLSYLNQLARLPSFTAPGTNTTLRVQSSTADETPSWNLLPSLDTELFAGLDEVQAAAEAESNPAVRHVRWFAYALRVLVVRFYTLAKNADSADIFVVLLGYVLMHYSFVQLFINMRKLGSNFWLGKCLKSCVGKPHIPSRTPVSLVFLLFLLLTITSSGYTRFFHICLPCCSPLRILAQRADRPHHPFRGCPFPCDHRWL